MANKVVDDEVLGAWCGVMNEGCCRRSSACDKKKEEGREEVRITDDWRNP